MSDGRVSSACLLSGFSRRDPATPAVEFRLQTSLHFTPLWDLQSGTTTLGFLLPLMVLGRVARRPWVLSGIVAHGGGLWSRYSKCMGAYIITFVYLLST